MDRHQRRKHLHHQRVKRAPQATVTQVHYLTLKPTFSGPVAGYSTVLQTKENRPTVKTTPSAPKPESTKAPQTTIKVQTTETPITPKKTTSSPKAITSSTRPAETSSAVTEEETDTVEVKTATSSETSLSLTETTASFTKTISSSLASHTVDSALESSTPTSIASKDGSGSGGASIGGIIGGCAAAVVLILFIAAFFYRKRKQRAMNEAYGKTEDEKSAGLAGGAAGMGVSGAASLNEKAPRVSLRPVTQFNPMLNPPAASPVVKTGPSGGAGGHGIPRKPIPAPLALSKPPQPDLRPSTSSSVSIPTAPVMPAAQPSPTLSAFSDGFMPGTPAAGPVDAAALAAAGKVAPVYRVQMEYIPSQADELELHLGGLVRMLHEYDDGWALCLRMDRSAQGVCPRTCLSARPVKPRPNPAPGSPASQQRRAPPPAHGRPPQGPVPQNSQARPQSPANSQRYIPYSGSRPGTPSQQQRPQTPKTPQNAQPLPQITVTPTEPEFPETQPETQPESQRETRVTPEPEASGNANAPVFHAM